MPRRRNPHAAARSLGVAIFRRYWRVAPWGRTFVRRPRPKPRASPKPPMPARTVSAATAGGAAQTLRAGARHSGRVVGSVSFAADHRAGHSGAEGQSGRRGGQGDLAAGAGERCGRSRAPCSRSVGASARRAAATRVAGRRLGLAADRRPLPIYSAGLNVSYTLDAFGGIRRQVEQLGAQAEYQRFELEATDLTLAANVINAAINEASLQAQIDTTRDIIQADTDALNLTKSRVPAWRRQPGGRAAAAIAAGYADRDACPVWRSSLQQQRNQLAVYLGGRPDQYAMPTLDLVA